mgnify:CR=1 FL=1
MCIRDRMRNVPQQVHRSAQSWPVGDAPLNLGQQVRPPKVHQVQFGLRKLANDPFEAIQHSQRAVSYTHLRAHETVLDLVCRLLLEKKKH